MIITLMRNIGKCDKW